MAIFTPPLAKFSPAARIIDPPLLGGAARPESATLTVTIIHAWSSMVVDVPGPIPSFMTFIILYITKSSELEANLKSSELEAKS